MTAEATAGPVLAAPSPAYRSSTPPNGSTGGTPKLGRTKGQRGPVPTTITVDGAGVAPGPQAATCGPGGAASDGTKYKLAPGLPAAPAAAAGVAALGRLKGVTPAAAAAAVLVGGVEEAPRLRRANRDVPRLALGSRGASSIASVDKKP